MIIGAILAIGLEVVLAEDGKCSVHANSPFGCAYFDQYMKDDEAERRNQPTFRKRDPGASLRCAPSYYL
jgi:hypothetical protein